MAQDTPGRLESIIKTEETPELDYGRWRDEIIMAEKELEDFRRRGRETSRRYTDERDAGETGMRKFNIFATNVSILESVLYAKLPKVSVSRRFEQPDDDPARVASAIMQNAVTQGFDDEDNNLDQVLRYAVQDRLVPGLGTAWLRLETETETATMEEMEGDPLLVDDEPVTYDKISYQEVITEHVNWEDFVYSPCRIWEERRWVGRRVYMDRDSLVLRFGDDPGKKIPLDFSTKGQTNVGTSNDPKNDILKKATIYEIWDRQTKRVLWLSKQWPSILDTQEDPLQLKEFEPCPKPLFALMTTSNCVPVNDFIMCQDQYNELDTVNNRISLLVEACKVVGVYDSSATGVKRMLENGSENTLIPVDSWAMFAEKGGIKGAVDWLPLDVIIVALEKLQNAREAIKAQIYELTGISDIVRGATKASETLGAQSLKAQYANVRIQKLQDEVARFAQEILQIKAQILAKHVSADQLLRMANMQFSPDMQQPELIQAAMQLIKGDDEEFCWRVKVEADSMGMVDAEALKKDRVEFTNAVATFLQSAATTLKAMPDTAPILFETLKYAVSGFRGAKDLEGVIDRNLTTIMQKIQNPPPPPPDPAVEKAKAEMAQSQQEFQQTMQIKQGEFQQKQQEFAMKQEAEQQKLALEREKFQQEMQMEWAKFHQELQAMQEKAAMELQLLREKTLEELSILQQKTDAQVEQIEVVGAAKAAAAPSKGE
jgi:hypothetical protein